MKVIITQNDIDNCPRFETTECPVATALGRAVKQEKGIWSVGVSTAIFGLRSVYSCEIDLPEHITEFITDFDSERKVIPTEFELNLATVRNLRLDENGNPIEIKQFEEATKCLVAA